MSETRASLFNEDFFDAVARVRDASVDLIVADPPYGLGKDYGNDSDRLVANDLRQNLLATAGFRILRFTAVDIYQRADVVVSLVRTALGPRRRVA